MQQRVMLGKRKVFFIVKMIYVISFLSISNLVITNLLDADVKILIPVENATGMNWDLSTYWYYPWGPSLTHKGIDIYSPHKTPVISPVNGYILETGYSNRGGNYIYLIAPNLRVYYFAHLNTITIKQFSEVKQYQLIGTVGNTGNASTKPYHLHFSIFSLFPIIKNYDRNKPEGWKKMFYLNPNKYFKS